MKRKTILTLSAIAAVAAIGAVTIPAIAGGPGGWGPGFHPGMMGHGPAMMQQQGWGNNWGGPGMTGPGGAGMMGPGGPGMMGPGGFGAEHLARFDTDGNGTVTPEELTAGIEALRTANDADGNGSLSRDEFGALVAEMTKSFADRPFAMLDADQNGELFSEELSFPATMMARSRDPGPAGRQQLSRDRRRHRTGRRLRSRDREDRQ
ncbi:MAG: calcium-binding protein [Paracoccaceae bacterium]|nr:calcium-binding protein [Maritimibacter sp.]